MLQSYPETGWIELRDERGTLWAEYHPDIKMLRRQKKLFGAMHKAYIPIDGLMDKQFAVHLTIEEIRKI